MPIDPEDIVSSKSSSQPTPIAFQLEDIRKYAAEILKKATDQAKRKLDAAGKQAEDIEKVAYDDGHKKGYGEGYPKGESEGRAHGEEAARAEFNSRVQGVAPVLESLIQELNERKIALYSQADGDLLRLSITIAERIVRRQIAVDEQFLLPVVREAILLANNRSDLIVRTHPDDIKALQEEVPNLHSAFTDLGKVHLEPDSTLERGDIRIFTREGEIDMRMKKQFEAIDRALMGLKPLGEQDYSTQVESVPSTLPVDESQSSAGAEPPHEAPDCSLMVEDAGGGSDISFGGETEQNNVQNGNTEGQTIRLEEDQSGVDSSAAAGVSDIGFGITEMSTEGDGSTGVSESEPKNKMVVGEETVTVSGKTSVEADSIIDDDLRNGVEGDSGDDSAENDGDNGGAS